MKLVMLGSGSYSSSLCFRLMDFARHLNELDWPITIILPSADKYNGFQADKTAKLDFATLLQPWQPATKNRLFNLLPYLFTSWYTLMRQRPDAIYLYKPTPINIVGLLPKLLRGTPVILDLDDLGSAVMKSEQQASIMVLPVKWCENLAIRYSSTVVVASSYLQALVKERYPDKAVLVIPNGVEPSNYKVTKTKARRAVYYYGAINRYELVADFITALPEIVKAVPDVKVTFAGGGEALGQVKKAIKKLGIEKNVLFTGWIQRDEVQDYVAFGDVAVCYQPDTPQVRAASNMKVFQYMAMGSVPVVSNVGDLGSYVEYGRIGTVVAPHQPAELAKAVQQLLLNDDDRMAKAKKAYVAAHHKHTLAMRAGALAKFAQEVTDGRQ